MDENEYPAAYWFKNNTTCEGWEILDIGDPCEECGEPEIGVTEITGDASIQPVPANADAVIMPEPQQSEIEKPRRRINPT